MMRSLTDFVLVVIYFAVLPCVVKMASLDLCQVKYGEAVVLHTSYKDGNRSCCKSIECSAGFEAVLCSPDNPASTSCRPCPPNTYQSYPTNSVDMKSCDVKTTCAVGMKIENDDSRTEDRRCLCDLEKGYCSPSRNRSMFCQRRSCPAGMELNQDCSCSECPDGYFKDVNGSMPCKMRRSCRDEGKETVVQGTTTTDAVCSSSTYNSRGGVTSTMAKAELSPTSPENILTSDSLMLSKESRLTTSDLDHTTLEIENPSSWKLVAIAVVTVIIAVMAVLVCVCVCFKHGIAQNIYAHCNSNRHPEKPPALVIAENQRILMDPPPVAEAQDEVCPRGQEVVQLLAQDDPDHNPHNQEESCNGPARENPPAGKLTLGLDVENACSPMTRAMISSLRTHTVVLLKNLVIDSMFLSLLHINNTITDEMRQTIQIEPISNSKTYKLLDYLVKRPCLSYKTFIFALVDTKQPHLAQLINAELAEEYAAYIESGKSSEEKILSFGCL